VLLEEPAEFVLQPGVVDYIIPDAERARQKAAPPRLFQTAYPGIAADMRSAARPASG